MFFKGFFSHRPGISCWVACLMAILFTRMFFDNFWHDTWSVSGFGISHFWLILIPMISLIAHIVYPSRFTWYIISIVCLIYVVFFRYRDDCYVNKLRNSAKFMAHDWIWNLVSGIITLLLAGAFFYFLRPRTGKKLGHA